MVPFDSRYLALMDYFKHQAQPRELSAVELEDLIDKQRTLELKSLEVHQVKSPTHGDKHVQVHKEKLQFLKEIHKNLLLCRFPTHFQQTVIQS